MSGQRSTVSDPALPAPLVDRFDVNIRVKGTLDEAQRARLEYIASRCPVHRTLKGTPEIHETVMVVPPY